MMQKCEHRKISSFGRTVLLHYYVFGPGKYPFDMRDHFDTNVWCDDNKLTRLPINANGNYSKTFPLSGVSSVDSVRTSHSTQNGRPGQCTAIMRVKRMRSHGNLRKLT